MPIDYKKYPPNWKTEVRPAILARAKNCCELCGVENYAIGVRNPDGAFVELGDDETQHIWAMATGFRVFKIVLTIAHKCDDTMCSDHDHLLALCQRCHLGLDRPLRKKHRIAKLGIPDLFPNN